MRPSTTTVTFTREVQLNIDQYPNPDQLSNSSDIAYARGNVVSLGAVGLAQYADSWDNVCEWRVECPSAGGRGHAPNEQWPGSGATSRALFHGARVRRAMRQATPLTVQSALCQT